MAQAQIIAAPMTPKTPTDPHPAGAQSRLLPALFARYGNLTALRHDYPLVLVEGEDAPQIIRPLSRIVDDALKAAAPLGPDGEAMRQQVLQLEQRIREKVAEGSEELLSELWRVCEADLVRESGEAPFGPMDRNMDLARQKVSVDGKVIGCDAATPDRILGHAWQKVHHKRARQFRKKVDGLILKLTDILKSDHMKSDEAHSADALSKAMGMDTDNSIDFSMLSDMLHRVQPEDRLPQDRVERIKHALHVLQTQAFFGPGRASYTEPGKAICYSYVFTSCSSALDAYRERLPSVVEFVKALTIAEMEVQNKYVSDLHDGIFATFDEHDLTAEQMALLPSAMIYLRDGVTDSAELARAYEALAYGLPIKVLIQVDDVLGPTSPEPPRNSFGAGTPKLAAMAMGLNNAFVMQTNSAHLYRMQDALMHGMAYDGPAMFSLYSGASETVEGIAPYILAAAAAESRAFPNFTYDPSAGRDIAGRFDLSANPQVEADWPSHEISFEDQNGNAVTESVQFTYGDFALCDRRYRRFCHPVSKKGWSGDMVAFAEWMKVPLNSDDIRRPFVLGVDDDLQMARIVVDDKISSAARQCLDGWNRLQEMAGINNSHTLAALAAERVKREDLAREQANSEPTAPVAPTLSSAPVDPIVEAAEEADAPSEGSPWIETPRCTTCNECRQINDRLFGYNDNLQAYIADPDAGSYRQLVEAAESCQVSIIHPGLPRDPDEPNLDELKERAKLFN
ncbi:ferredoxin [Cohaesibacter sp. CAU 1516]|uniref:ferredoxin n=1 Tax=Cohaesibacter sp. CAU 1516 TaxID=2576038 RepID=UPI0010FEB803|nr:ferredoxin [Cohaesibacter sp. CAU 1516]TLP46202.1 ferredoxin [Cohaesibacter sp. CAU 1516]